MSNDKAPAGEGEPSTPQRLHGLSTRGGRGGLRGGRFLPNAVGRRSKEERESTAPAVKPQPPSPQAGNDRDSRKRFDRRKQRQLGTRAEAAGPLAAPTIAAAAGSARATRSTGTATTSGSTGAQGGVNIKSETNSALSSALASDVRINMAATSAGDRASYIPLRMPTDSVTPISIAAEATGEIENAEDANGDEKQQIHAAAEVPGTAEAKLDMDQLTHDHLELDEGNLYLLQLPDLGLMAGKAPPASPLYDTRSEIRPSTTDVTMGDAGAVRVKDETVEAGSLSENGAAVVKRDAEKVEKTEADTSDVLMDEPLSEPVIGASGRLGSLRKHASGKLSMVLGGSVYEVIKGTHGTSSEELLILNDSNRSAQALGTIKSRVLVIPDLESLHI